MTVFLRCKDSQSLTTHNPRRREGLGHTSCVGLYMSSSRPDTVLPMTWVGGVVPSHAVANDERGCRRVDGRIELTRAQL